MKDIFENEAMNFAANRIARSIEGCLPDLMGSPEADPSDYRDELHDYAGDYILDHSPKSWTDEDRHKLRDHLVKYWCGEISVPDCTFPVKALELKGVD